MAKEKQPPKGESSAPAAYQRLLARVSENLDQFAKLSGEILQRQLQDAVELEAAAEQMTRDELDLISAYVKRDLQSMYGHLHETGEGVAGWLSFDLNALEYTLGQQLQQLADQTRIEQQWLDERLALKGNQYIAGEICGAGTLGCMQCQQTVRFTEAAEIEPCHQCGSEFFQRRSVSQLDEIG